MTPKRSPDCPHQLQVLNFQPTDVTPCAIVRLLGLTSPSRSLSCPDPEFITLTLKGTSRQLPARRRFKALLEVAEGRNDVILQFGCRRLEVRLDHVPPTSLFTVLPLYVICAGHSGEFQAPPTENCDPQSACRRIHLASKLLQTFTAEKLQETGLGRRTFTLEDRCHVFRSALPAEEARRMSQEALWTRIGTSSNSPPPPALTSRVPGRDIMRSPLRSQRRKYLAFLSCTRYDGLRFTSELTTHEDALKITEAYVALGGGGLALFGSASLHSWPEAFEEIAPRFLDATPIDPRHLLDDSCYRGTLGASFSTTLGAVLHELFHCFDLGHSRGGVMGRGFDQISRFYVCADEGEEAEGDRTPLERSCAVLLAYHRWLGGSAGAAREVSLVYDAHSGAVKATAGIRVVELRRREDQLIGRSWTFEGRVLRHFFQLPPEARLAPFLLVVEDNCGNILKQEAQ
ncbi:hypothetical protein HUJ04_000324 [Dendroctonus ponderosae]|nr:hypothetical protein HUJ04_000324 [Dendroctonus ponderosae]KAH1000414.1 hypothetical protein HUJ04_000324 [Dendroctonus ponderosae]